MSRLIVGLVILVAAVYLVGIASYVLLALPWSTGRS